jgi:membrane fusion protein, copper/silver efflux system
VIRKTLLLILLFSFLIAGFLLGRIPKRSNSNSSSARKVLYYVDPMHPAYRSSKPGIAPDCGMQLVPVYAEDLVPQHASGSTDPNMVYIDSGTRQRYGIQLAKVERGSGNNTLRVYGRVAPDQSSIYTVNLGTDGYVKATSGDAIGNHVTKDQHLAVVYSPEFLSVVGGYLSANERTPGANTKDSASATQNAASAEARADRLRNLGMSDVQIDEVRATRKIPEDVYVVSPTDGFIIARNISPGMRFMSRDNLYTIADLSHVWVLPEVFGKDAEAFRPGATVHITLPDTGETFTARVSNVLPALDPITHALKPRLEVANPAFHLRPDMFVDIELPTMREGLSIPADAIVNTGLAKHVFVAGSDNNFEQREVQTGWSSGDRVQITKGLQEGEMVVSSGTFLVDSETRIHPATGATHTAGSSSGAEMMASNGVR